MMNLPLCPPDRAEGSPPPLEDELIPRRAAVGDEISIEALQERHGIEEEEEDAKISPYTPQEIGKMFLLLSISHLNPLRGHHRDPSAEGWPDYQRSDRLSDFANEVCGTCPVSAKPTRDATFCTSRRSRSAAPCLFPRGVLKGMRHKGGATPRRHLDCPGLRERGP
jgi:hypothetical protein